jgi:hypothetical protein
VRGSLGTGLALALFACAPAAPHANGSDAELPCAIDVILRARCQECHTDPPRNGAPMPLVTYADTQQAFTLLPTYDRIPTWIVMGDAVRSGVMPAPYGGRTFPDVERDTLLSWIAAGAASREQGRACE